MGGGGGHWNQQLVLNRISHEHYVSISKSMSFWFSPPGNGILKFTKYSPKIPVGNALGVQPRR